MITRNILFCLALMASLSISCNTAHSNEVTQEASISPSTITNPTDVPLSESKIELKRITSTILGYDLQYWVHLPKGYSANKSYPTLYVTDGLWYKDTGELPAIADDLIAKNQIAPIITIYVDAYDPDNSNNNRRNSQFLCNPKYVKFYKKELIPTIDQSYSTQDKRDNRGLLGLSFGGLNSMYFGIHASDVFSKIGIQSPAPHPCPDIYDEYASRKMLPIDFYLSTGTVNDKARDTRRLKNILEGKGYDFAYAEVPEGHNWKNWKPLLDDILLRFYPKA